MKINGTSAVGQTNGSVESLHYQNMRNMERKQNDTVSHATVVAWAASIIVPAVALIVWAISNGIVR